MKSTLVSILIGVAIVIVAAGFLTRDIPMERIVSDIDKPSINPASPIQEKQESAPVSTTKQNECDSSYPDFCIPSPPPDLDCGDIAQKRFTVLQPDPHRFDGDKDGIGCES